MNLFGYARKLALGVGMGKIDKHDTIEFSCWQVYAGIALTDPDERPVELVLDPDVVEGLGRVDPVYWQAVLAYIESDLRERSE